MKKFLISKSKNLSEWYNTVIQQAKLADYSPIRGCMVIRPNGFALWENFQKALDPMLKELGAENAYFPLFIPMSFLKKEADHIEGFAPELAVVTHGGGEKLQEELAVRPTSETIMYDTFRDWVASYRDLPLVINQWNNVVRWEKRTYLFLRTSEFLWSETHTAHATKEEAMEMVYVGLDAYKHAVEDFLAVPVFTGRKSESEKFAGAEMTTTIEAVMPDGKALQSGTSHFLGQNFSQKSAFDINFLDQNGENQYVWQTSYGISTRIIGSLIMVHGDDDGLVLPPEVAGKQIVLVPTNQDEKVIELTCTTEKKLGNFGIRVFIDKSFEHTLGYRLNDIELQGSPLICVIGPKEVESESLAFKARFNGHVYSSNFDSVVETVQGALEKIQNQMFDQAKKQAEDLLFNAETWEEFKNIMAGSKGMIQAFWCEDAQCERQIKEETKATVRCLPFIDNKGSVQESQGNCIKCGKEATHKWLFAQAY